MTHHVRLLLVRPGLRRSANGAYEIRSGWHKMGHSSTQSHQAFYRGERISGAGTLRDARRAIDRHAAASTCRWFALCDRPATKTRKHPVLGDVPICDRCDAKVEALS